MASSLSRRLFSQRIVLKLFVSNCIKAPRCSLSTLKPPQAPIEGIFPPICTPFSTTQDERILWNELESNFKKWEKIAFTGYVVHGSNGEMPFLTASERLDMVKAVKANAGKDKVIISGAGCESLKETLEFIEAIAKLGVHYALVLTPHFYKSLMTELALEEYYTRLADKSPIPIIMYNVPKFTNIDMSIQLCVNLSSHPNIIGLKDSSGDIPKLATINKQAKEDRIDFTHFAGSAGFLLDALQAGSSGGICALANVLGNELVDIYNAFKNNDMATAVALQKRIAKANQCVTSLYGVPALKAALDANGYYGGPCRSPIMKVRPSDLQHTKNSFKTNGFSWMD